jgi:hypothetical protein
LREEGRKREPSGCGSTRAEHPEGFRFLPSSPIPLPCLLAQTSVHLILVLPEHIPNQTENAWTPRSTGQRQLSKESRDRVSFRPFRAGSGSSGSLRRRPPRRIRQRRSCVERDGGDSPGTTSAVRAPSSSSCGHSRSCRPPCARCAGPQQSSARRGSVASTPSARGMRWMSPSPVPRLATSTTARGHCSETPSRRQ